MGMASLPYIEKLGKMTKFHSVFKSGSPEFRREVARDTERGNSEVI